MKVCSRVFDILSQPSWAQGDFSRIQCPNRFRMLGLTVPPMLLARTDEVIRQPAGIEHRAVMAPAGLAVDEQLAAAMRADMADGDGCEGFTARSHA
jgi:hypothetical protein